MNLPTKVNFGNGDSIVWTYTVSGSKLRKAVYDNGALIKTIDYISGYVYKNNQLDFFFMEQGRVKKLVSGSLRYEYDIKDHLGNTRVCFADTNSDGAAEILEESHYYAFGSRIEGLSTSSPNNKFTYNGKELEDDHGLNRYHYGARYYDPQLGRWHAVDTKDEFYSPYCYVKNDPINFVDLDGTGIQGGEGGQAMMYKMVGTENMKYISFDGEFMKIDESGYNPTLTEGATAIYLAYKSNNMYRLDCTNENVDFITRSGELMSASPASMPLGIITAVKDGMRMLRGT